MTKQEELEQWLMTWLEKFNPSLLTTDSGWVRIPEEVIWDYRRYAKQILTHFDSEGAVLKVRKLIPHRYGKDLEVGKCEECHRPLLIIDSYSHEVGISDMLRAGFNSAFESLVKGGTMKGKC